MQRGLVAHGSGEAEEHDGVARLRVELLEVNRSDFEKPKSKEFKKMMDSQMGTIGGCGIRTIGDGGASQQS
jgi:hypothetical protein